MVGGIMLAPSTPTCRDRISYYFVVAECLSHAAPVACTIGDGGFYPHRPARLLIRTKARAAVVRQLKVPTGFSAVLPHGPEPKPMQTPSDVAIGGETAGIVERTTWG